MASGSGYILLHRKLWDSNMYNSLNSKQRDVLIQCLLMANFQENNWEWQGEIYRCKRGQFITSLDSLAKKCGKDVKVQSVRTALLKLEKWHFLTNKSTKTGRLITIINWDTYQRRDDKTNKDANKEPTKSQQRANKELTPNNNVKNEKNDNKKKKGVFIPSNNGPADRGDTGNNLFEALWEAYPGTRKKGKKAAYKHFKASIKTLQDEHDIKLALSNYLKDINANKTEDRFIPYGSTWFNNWNDYVKHVPQEEKGLELSY